MGKREANLKVLPTLWREGDAATLANVGLQSAQCRDKLGYLGEIIFFRVEKFPNHLKNTVMSSKLMTAISPA